MDKHHPTTHLDCIAPLMSLYHDEEFVSAFESDGEYGRIAQASSEEFTVVRRRDTFELHYDIYIELDGCLYMVFEDAKCMSDALFFIEEFKALVSEEARMNWDVVSEVLWRLDDLEDLKDRYREAA